MYIDRFAARGSNKVNWLGVWERTYSLTLCFRSVSVDIVCWWSVSFCAKTINIVDLATRMGLYIGHLDLLFSLWWIYFCGGRWNISFVSSMLLQLRWSSFILLAFFYVTDSQWYADTIFLLKSIASNFKNVFKWNVEILCSKFERYMKWDTFQLIFVYILSQIAPLSCNSQISQEEIDQLGSNFV